MQLVEEAREWLMDIFPELEDEEEIASLEAAGVWAAVDRYYSGGSTQFAIDGDAREAAERVAARARAASRMVETRRGVICQPSDLACTVDHPWRHSTAHWNEAVRKLIEDDTEDDYALGPCGCTDYHLADCDLLTGGSQYEPAQAEDGFWE